MPSFRDQDSSIIEFYHEEPELEMIDKGIQIDHRSDYQPPPLAQSQFTIRNNPSSNSSPSTSEPIPNQPTSLLNQPPTPTTQTCSVEDPEIQIVAIFEKGVKLDHLPDHHTFPVQSPIQNVPTPRPLLSIPRPILGQPALSNPFPDSGQTPSIAQALSNTQNVPTPRPLLSIPRTILSQPSLSNTFPATGQAPSLAQAVCNNQNAPNPRTTFRHPRLSNFRHPPLSNFRHPPLSNHFPATVQTPPLAQALSNTQNVPHPRRLPPTPRAIGNQPTSKPLPATGQTSQPCNSTSIGLDTYYEVLTPSNSEKVKMVNKIKASDIQIEQVENSIKALKIKEKGLIKHRSTESSDNIDRPLYFSLPHKIYSENRAKVKQSLTANKHQKTWDFPLYNQPKDTDVYHENLERHALFKNRLIAYLENNKQETIRKENIMIRKYNNLMETWKKRTQQIESSKNWQEKQSAYYECFSRSFPEPEVQKSYANQNKIKNKESANVVVIPPFISNKKYKFVANRDPGLMDDPLGKHDLMIKIFLNKWSTDEKETFIKHFKSKPKNFSVELAKELQDKSVKDCVQFYYLTKHEDPLRAVIISKKKRKVSDKKKTHVGKKKLVY